MKNTFFFIVEVRQVGRNTPFRQGVFNPIHIRSSDLMNRRSLVYVYQFIPRRNDHGFRHFFNLNIRLSNSCCYIDFGTGQNNSSSNQNCSGFDVRSFEMNVLLFKDGNGTQSGDPIFNDDVFIRNHRICVMRHHGSRHDFDALCWICQCALRCSSSSNGTYGKGSLSIGIALITDGDPVHCHAIKRRKITIRHQIFVQYRPSSGCYWKADGLHSHCVLCNDVQGLLIWNKIVFHGFNLL